MTPLAFIDTETTGLDAAFHEVWEVAVILRDDDHADVEYVWQLPVDLSVADPKSLEISGYIDRRWAPGRGNAGLVGNPDERTKRHVVHETAMVRWCREFMELTRGVHIVGAVPSFDEERLRRLLRRHGSIHMWHYHIVDIEPLMAGYLLGRPSDTMSAAARVVEVATPPWNSTELSETLGVDRSGYEKHTALGDARWARDVYDAVMVGGA